MPSRSEIDGDQPSDLTKNILQFCEQFEAAGQRTQAFMKELTDAGLIMEGEVSIQPDGAEQPFIYRGFRMVDEEKLRNMRGDELRKLNQNGALALIFAHLMSLGQIRDIFYRQVTQGKGPMAVDAPTSDAAPANVGQQLLAILGICLAVPGLICLILAPILVGRASAIALWGGLFSTAVGLGLYWVAGSMGRGPSSGSMASHFMLRTLTLLVLLVGIGAIAHGVSHNVQAFAGRSKR